MAEENQDENEVVFSDVEDDLGLKEKGPNDEAAEKNEGAGGAEN